MIIILNETSTWRQQARQNGMVLKNVVSDYYILVIQMNILVLFRIQKPCSITFAFVSTLLMIVSRFLMGSLWGKKKEKESVSRKYGQCSDF